MRRTLTVITLIGILGIMAMPAMSRGLAANTVSASDPCCMHVMESDFEFASSSFACCVWLEGKLAAKKHLLADLKKREGADKERVRSLAFEIRELETTIQLKKRKQALSPADFFYGYTIAPFDRCKC